MRKPPTDFDKVITALRKNLKRNFPDAKIRVVPHKAQRTANVLWSLSPTPEAVKVFIAKYKDKPGVKGIFVARGYGSDHLTHEAFIENAAREVCALIGKEYKN